MARTFTLSILAPDKIVYEGTPVSLVAPSAFGYLGVLADHAPLAANLVSGKIIVRELSGGVTTFHLHGKGFLEVVSNTATVILSQPFTDGQPTQGQPSDN